MSGSYWDTSCVLPLYVAEAATAELVALVSGEQGALTSSCILEFEFLFALQAKVTRGQLPGALADRARKQFLHDVDKGRFMLTPLGRDVARRCLEMSSFIAEKLPETVLRTLDGIHLATALHLRCTKIVTADAKLAAMATAAGLQVGMPAQ